MSTPKTYNDNFYSVHAATALSSAREIIPLVMEIIQPASVIDVGCGTGVWLSVWKEYGVKKTTGLDGNHIKPEELVISQEEFTACNLEEDFYNGDKYDLISCLEVAEHLRPASAEKFISSLCKFGDIILFSAAIPHQEGTLHVNEQYPDYWMKLFAKNDFEALDSIREKIWDNEKIDWWYRQNILVFVHKNAITSYREKTGTNKKVMAMVHPALLEHKQNRINQYEKALKNPLTALAYFVKRLFK